MRHLQPVQIYGRLLFQAARPNPDLRPAPPLRLQGPWVLPPQRRQSLVAPDTFRLLNETRSLGAHSWDDPAVEKLWRYNLHYFDDLNAEGAVKRAEWHVALIRRWIVENPSGGGTGWEPYPTSLRIVNWIKWAQAGNALPREAMQSLAVQARWLMRRLEYHLLGNHLFSNAKALVFAGCFFDGAEAEAWRELGQRILAREIPEQILADGGHLELSTMYHALALEDMLDLKNMLLSAGLPAPVTWDEKIAAMRRWLATMCHPDGEIAFFNDAAFGIAPPPGELERYATALGLAPSTPIGPGCTWLRDSGYVRLQNDRAVVLIDVGRIGPDYLPGHAHADTLSFELSVDGKRIIVNSGTSIYGSGPERLRQRGTAAHNTVTVDDQNSSEVWSGFRVARRARPERLSVTRQGDDWLVACGHDGYTRLKDCRHHFRSWRFGKDRLVVSDRVEGGHCSAAAAFHFHPEPTPSTEDDGATGTLAAAEKTLLCWCIKKGTAKVEPSSWHPEFGISQPAQRLMLSLFGGESLVEFRWTDT
jgi:uncharacterized heparinase superfamily protein